ncbi:beta-methylarginine biosynthesis bifunctional aminotransferase [Paracidovorax cattleyae]|uniref:Aminotransferase n=2 Tax=Paracidovorax cattleyae TaxID=80868 RepID=A0A1H0L4E0_9BURK|nr:beta-methylarginine biosynthesis bifunctional aminotransferase [Paracidovorax cattleyae]
MMRLHERHRIVRTDSSLSTLQQRLKYARWKLQDQACYFVENVPVWPSTELPAPTSARDDIFQYADCNGNPGLLDAICMRDNATYGLGLAKENILITNGAMHGLSLAFRHAKSHAAGSCSAICLAPVFGAVPALLSAEGYKMVYYHMQQEYPCAAELLALCRPDTRLIYLNFPHNPLGGIYPGAFMQALVPALAERGIALVLDMVYDGFIFGSEQLHSPFHEAEDFSSIYTVNSMSKNYGAPGLRVGWLTSSIENIEAMAGLVEIECVAVCTPAQTKAASLIVRGNERLRRQVLGSRTVVHDFLRRTQAGYSELPPAGTQVFVDLPVDDVEEFADQVLGDFGLVLATASNYSGVSGQYIRIPTSYPEHVTREALDLLSQGLERYAGH